MGAEPRTEPPGACISVDYSGLHQVRVEPGRRRSSGNFFSEHARTLGLDGATFDACLASRRHAARVNRGLDDGLAAGVQGTPGFVVAKTTRGDTVEGTPVRGALPVEVFRRLIDQLLAEK